jgi:putative component of toxin-antitoxin plasmid stabilization module
MVENEHITDLQEIKEVFNDYLTIKKDKVSRYKVQHRLNNVTTRNCYSNQNDIHPSSCFVFKTF